MNRLIIFLAASLFMVSCSKDIDLNPQTPEGNWRMVLVQDNGTGTYSKKSPAISGDIDISFVTVSPEKGFINGNTPTNNVTGYYLLEDNKMITFTSLSTTEVVETSWGLEFLSNIASAKNYYFNRSGRLIIQTEKKRLIFQRL